MRCPAASAVYTLWHRIHLLQELLYWVVCGQFHVVLGVDDHLRHLAGVGVEESAGYDYAGDFAGFDWKGKYGMMSSMV